MSPNFSILASIFQNFPGGHAPRPPSSSMLCTPLPNLELAPPPPFTNPRSAPVVVTRMKVSQVYQNQIQRVILSHHVDKLVYCHLIHLVVLSLLQMQKQN